MLRGVKDGLKWWEFVPADGGDEQEIWGAGMSCWSIESPLYKPLWQVGCVRPVNRLETNFTPVN